MWLFPWHLVGIFEIFSKRKETFNFLSGTGASLGVMAILFPTASDWGVCQSRHDLQYDHETGPDIDRRSGYQVQA